MIDTFHTLLVVAFTCSALAALLLIRDWWQQRRVRRRQQLEFIYELRSHSNA